MKVGHRGRNAETPCANWAWTSHSASTRGRPLWLGLCAGQERTPQALGCGPRCPGLLGSKAELCPPGPWAVALTGIWVCAEGVGTASSQARLGLTPRVWGLERSGGSELRPKQTEAGLRCEGRGDGLVRMPSRAPSGQPHPGPGLQPVRTQFRGPGMPPLGLACVWAWLPQDTPTRVPCS